MGTQRMLSRLHKNIIYIAIVILLFLIIGAIVYFVPSADVTVGVPFKNYPLNMTLIANATSSRNATPGTVATQTLTYNVSASDKGSATGTDSVGNAQATGSVIFTNKSSQPIEIPTGTLLSTASGIIFVTTLDIQIPPANSTYMPPVSIQAQNQGINGNVAANTIVNITSEGQQHILNFNPGLASTSVLTVTNPQPTTGGGAGKATALSTNDVNTLKAKLNVVLQTQLQDWLAKQLLIGDNAGKPVVVETVTTTPDVGSVVAGGTFSETLKMQATVLVVRSATLQSAAFAQMNNSVSKNKLYPGYTLYQPQQLKITQLKNAPSNDGLSLNLSFTAFGQIIPTVTEDQIRSLLAGKKVSEVKSTLTGPGGIPGVVSSSAVVHPGFLPWLPFFSSHITVHIVPTQSTTSGETVPPQSTTGGGAGDFLGLPYGLLAIISLLLIILPLLLVSLIVVWRRRREMEREVQAAERIRMKEVTRHISGPMTVRQGQSVQPGQAVQPAQSVPSPFADPAPVQRMQAGSQRVPTDLRCPNCNYPYRGETYCSNCRVGLALSESGYHVRYVRLVQPPREEKQEQKQDNGLSVQKKAGNDEPPKVIEVPPQEAMSDDEKENGRVGQQFGNYKLLRSLGEGGFAEVYLGEHIHLGSNAAIKILSGRLTGEEQEKFRLEARTLVRLVHPHIVRLLEFGIEDKVPFLVMDYAANGTLRQRHPKGSRLPLPLVVNYVKQAAEALQFAHDLKFIHRDIKPENMLVGSRNEILLSDFGIAIVAQSSRYQNPQDMAGTVTYMAPEQIQLHPRPASDQYALGVVTYEWLCGSRPFQGSFTEIAIKHSTVLPPPLRQKVSTIPLPVEQVVLKSLAKDPKERFESVQKFAIALEQASLS